MKYKTTHFAYVEEWHWDGKTHGGKAWTEGKIRLKLQPEDYDLEFVF